MTWAIHVVWDRFRGHLHNMFIVWKIFQLLVSHLDCCVISLWSSSALASSAPIWQFIVPCGDFYRVVTRDFTSSGVNCSSNIRRSWKAVDTISVTGANVYHLVPFCLNQNCVQNYLILMLIIDLLLSCRWGATMAVSGVWTVFSFKEPRGRIRIQGVASGNMGEFSHGGLSVWSQLPPATPTLAYQGTIYLNNDILCTNY